MARILAISSQVVFGPVGLNAIVPALQANGHEVLALPTILLSNHPGHGKPVGHSIDLQAMIDALEKLGALKNIDAITTGYFSTAMQVEIIAQLIAKLKCPLVLIDPVLGDHGKLYVPETVAVAIRDQLVPLASILTPNVFELSWLSGIAVTNRETAVQAARKLNLKEVIATSVMIDAVTLGTLRITANTVDELVTPKRDHVPNGLGDFLSGLYLARQFSEARLTALPDSMKVLQRAIALSHNTGVLAVAEALHRMETKT
jgi:pyridoxine kinase